MQRFFDILFSLISLILISPFFVTFVVILKLTGEGEVFFLHKRSGKHEKEFKMIKFATMLKNSPFLGTKDITLKDDQRVLKFGKFLRMTKINELPQLINILIGDMSIVGPRPLTKEQFAKYDIKSRKLISSIEPGLTGIGSIVFRDEEKYLDKIKNPIKFYNDHILPYKSKLEIWYLSNRSIKNYFILIFITAWVIFFKNSEICFKVFQTLPKKPEYMK